MVQRGLTTADVAERYRVSQGKVVTWIRTGQLRAINTATSGKPRFIIPADALEVFEQRRTGAVQPTIPRRRQKYVATEDYFPDV